MKKRIIQLYSLFQEDVLFRNSLYLMLATAVMAGFGFFFWMISARLAPPENIGIATTLISIMSVISIFSLVGFDSTLVRFLNNSKNRNNELNTAMLIVGVTALFLASIFIYFIHHISPRLEPIFTNRFYSLCFIMFCIMSAINSLTDSVFLAYRQAKYSLIINFIFSFIKMLLPLFLAVWGAFGIFSSAALGQTIGFILSVGIIIWKFDYRPQFIISKDVLQEVWRYSAGNYIAMALNLLPVTVLPLIITNQLSSKESAYFYIVMMIGNLLYVIPLASSKSLFAEGSHDENSITKNIKKTIKTISVFLIPSMVALLIGGKFILGFFGKSYSHEGLGFLYLVALSAISVSIYSLISVIFKIKKLIRPLIVTNALYATGVIGCSYLFISYGLLGIGYAWLVGNSVAALSGWILYIYFYRPKTIASLS